VQVSGTRNLTQPTNQNAQFWSRASVHVSGTRFLYTFLERVSPYKFTGIPKHQSPMLYKLHGLYTAVETAVLMDMLHKHIASSSHGKQNHIHCTQHCSATCCAQY